MRAPLPVRWLAGGLSRLAPSPSAHLAARLFLRTQRPGRPAREKAWLRSAVTDPLRVDGQRIASWTWGAELDESAPAVLLIHGWAGRGSQLGALGTALAAAGVRAVTFDAPGHGSSEGSWSTLPKMAEAVLAVANRTGPLAGVIAHSAGAAATTLALQRGLGTRRAVYISPPAELATFAVMFGEALGLTPRVQRGLKRSVEDRVGMRWEEIHGLDVARDMTTPLLVIHDHDDAELPLEGARSLVAAWSGSRLLTTRGLGHRRLLRDETVVGNALRFLSPQPASAEA